MTTANVMRISSAAVLRAPTRSARHINRRAALVVAGLFHVLVLAYLLVAVAGSWPDTRAVVSPAVSAPPTRTVHVALGSDPVTVPARPQPGFAPR